MRRPSSVLKIGAVCTFGYLTAVVTNASVDEVYIINSENEDDVDLLMYLLLVYNN